jgi:hypothetical protein
MRDDVISPDTATTAIDIAQYAVPAVAPAPAVTLPLNAISALNPVLPGLLANTSVDIINNLTQGMLLQILPGVTPGPQTRTYDLSALPDAGAGNIALPLIVAVPGKGSIAAVNDAGVPVSSGGTGFSFTGGAYASSLNPISSAIFIAAGWAFSFTYRVPSGTKNSGKSWVAIGQRQGTNYGISVSETGIGALLAVIEDPRQTAVKVQSANVGRDAQHTARLVWNAATQLVQWFVDGVASGPAVTLSWVPQIGGGQIQLCSNLVNTATVTPIGALYRFVFEAVPADQVNSYIPVGPSATMRAADAASLVIDTGGIFRAVGAAGDVSFSYQTASGSASQDVTVGYGGYVQPAETLTSYVSAEMPYCPIDQGSADANASVLVLTAPYRGKIQTPFSTQLFGPGALAQLTADGIPQLNFLLYQPAAGGIAPGQNVNGSMQRGATDLVRTQQDTTVRVTNLIEMNRPPRLNGGGEAWGHANDLWVPIAALEYQYNTGTFQFPTIDQETPVVTVTGLPGQGEGTIRVLRTGTDLKIGDTVPFAAIKQLGWNKPGVASVGAACALRLDISAPGAPIASETYGLKITDAGRPAGLGWWEQANVRYSDLQARIRWANRGGDWAGVDGPWGAVPFVTSPTLTKATTLTLDVTQMVQGGGTEFFIAGVNATGTISVTPGFYTPNSALEPALRVTGGTRAGTYPVTRCAPIVDADSTGWRAANPSPQAVRRGQPLLIAFDGAGTSGQLATADKIELILNVVGASGGGGALQLFRPAAQPPRPGPRVSVTATPTAQRADLIAKVDTDAEWNAMIGSVDARNRAGVSHPMNYTIANGCYYGGIPIGRNGGLSLFKGFWKADGTGYPVVRIGRMVGWHQNYQPADASIASGLIVSGKSPGIIATGSASLSILTSGFGGRIVDGLGGYTVRSERGVGSGIARAAGSPMANYLAFGDYNYFVSGDTNGLSTFAINPVPRMAWVWIETVLSANSVNADGTWSNDGVFELYVNGRKQCESRRLEWRVGGNSWLWDAIWFDEYNGGTAGAQADRLWPFVVGPTYVVASADPIAPPPGWNVPFVTAAGTPDAVTLAYSPDW